MLQEYATDASTMSLLISPAMSILVDSCSNDIIVLWMSSTFSCLLVAAITWAVEPIAWAILAWDCIVYTNERKVPLLAEAVPTVEEGRLTCIWCPVEVILELMLRDFAFCCRSLTSCLAYTAHVWGTADPVNPCHWTTTPPSSLTCLSPRFAAFLISASCGETVNARIAVRNEAMNLSIQWGWVSS